MAGEKEEDYCWALQQYKAFGIKTLVLVGDQEIAFHNAARKVFPSAHIFVCTWHYNKTILVNATKKWIRQHPQPTADDQEDLNEMERDGFCADFARILTSPSTEEFNTRYEELLRKWRKQTALLAYIEDKFYPIRRHLVDCWTNRFRHYGVRVSSTCEGAHAELKGFLYTSTGNLKYVADKFDLWIDKKKRRYEVDLEKAKTRHKHTHRQELLRYLIGRISPFAMDLILDQKEYSQKEGFSIATCKKQFTESYGLPCAHTLRRMEIDGIKSIPMEEIDSHWHYTEQPVNSYTFHIVFWD